MSSHSSPSHYTEDAFVTDANFKVEINQKMKVPDRISFNTELNGNIRNAWAKDNFSMNVPERILVAGQDQHVGTRAPPREIDFDNSLLQKDPYPRDNPRVATPPRTLTLDRYPFPGVENYNSDEQEDDYIPVIKSKSKGHLNDKVHLNDTSFQLSNSLRDNTSYGGGGEGLTPAEEVVHLRRQLAKLNRRVVALELENLSKLQKDKLVLGFGIAYFLLKVIIWMNKEH